MLYGGALDASAPATALRSAPNGSLPMAVHAFLAGAPATKGDDGFGYAPLPADWLPR